MGWHECALYERRSSQHHLARRQLPRHPLAKSVLMVLRDPCISARFWPFQNPAPFRCGRKAVRSSCLCAALTGFDGARQGKHTDPASRHPNIPFVVRRRRYRRGSSTAGPGQHTSPCNRPSRSRDAPAPAFVLDSSGCLVVRSHRFQDLGQPERRRAHRRNMI